MWLKIAKQNHFNCVRNNNKRSIKVKNATNTTKVSVCKLEKKPRKNEEQLHAAVLQNKRCEQRTLTQKKQLN